MNKLGHIGIGLVAVASMGGGMLLTGAASASSPTGLMTVHNDVMTVHNDVDPGSRPAQHCVITASANEAAPDSGLAVPAGDVGGPIGSVDMAPGFTWQSVSIAADGKVTVDQGTDADMPTKIDAAGSHTSGAVAVAADGSSAVSIPEADIKPGGSCRP